MSPQREHRKHTGWYVRSGALGKFILSPKDVRLKYKENHCGDNEREQRNCFHQRHTNKQVSL